MATLLAKMNEEQAQQNELARQDAYRRLRAALEQLLPRQSEIWVFGSLLRPGRFKPHSDIDLAIYTCQPVAPKPGSKVSLRCASTAGSMS
jgi:predicted nucleotidyltransferase